MGPLLVFDYDASYDRTGLLKTGALYRTPLLENQTDSPETSPPQAVDSLHKGTPSQSGQTRVVLHLVHIEPRQGIISLGDRYYVQLY